MAIRVYGTLKHAGTTYTHGSEAPANLSKAEKERLLESGSLYDDGKREASTKQTASKQE